MDKWCISPYGLVDTNEYRIVLRATTKPFKQSEIGDDIHDAFMLIHDYHFME